MYPEVQRIDVMLSSAPEPRAVVVMVKRCDIRHVTYNLQEKDSESVTQKFCLAVGSEFVSQVPRPQDIYIHRSFRVRSCRYT